MNGRILRSTAALRPAVLGRPAVAQRALHASSQARQAAEPPRSQGRPASGPPPEEPVKKPNTYLAVGGGGIALAFMFWYITGKPEKATEVAKEGKEALKR
ncbi:hypothetical protein G7046_g4625 [Stylonectria norvegica]|nr:hypothetical protein G7046_g4625 [Stylonectria norvegica]